MKNLYMDAKHFLHIHTTTLIGLATELLNFYMP